MFQSDQIRRRCINRIGRDGDNSQTLSFGRWGFPNGTWKEPRFKIVSLTGKVSQQIVQFSRMEELPSTVQD